MSKGLESVRAFIKSEFEKIRKPVAPVAARQIETACLMPDKTTDRFAVKSKRLANQAILRVPLHRSDNTRRMLAISTASRRLSS